MNQCLQLHLKTAVAGASCSLSPIKDGWSFSSIDIEKSPHFSQTPLAPFPLRWFSPLLGSPGSEEISRTWEISARNGDRIGMNPSSNPMISLFISMDYFPSRFPFFSRGSTNGKSRGSHQFLGIYPLVK